MEPLALAIVFALALFLVLRRPGVFSPALVWAGASRSPVPPPGDEEEQLPETDRAPRPWLPLGVAAVATVRLVCLLTLHA